ncbi:MAG: DUF4398 domain-containing protein [Steroidobacteraceae bacterium]
MSSTFFRSASLSALAAAGIGLMSACSSNPPANVVAQMTRTETSIGQAEQAGAQQGALKDLQQAKSKQAEAQKAFDKHDYKLTLRLAEEAQVDAQYAAAKAQTAQEQQAAADAQKSINTLRQEATRPNP